MAMQFDTAYLSLRSNGLMQKGTYHGLGPTTMKKIIIALDKPRYIVRLKNGRYNVIIEGEKSSLISIELTNLNFVMESFLGKFDYHCI